MSKAPQERDLPACRRQTTGWQLYAGWRTGVEAGRPEGLPRTAAITTSMRMQKRLQSSKRFCIPQRVAKPGRHEGDGRTIRCVMRVVQGEKSKCGHFEKT